MPRLRVAAAQQNLVVGDLEGNATRILAAYEQAEDAGVDLVAFPELAITGYPPEDLLLRPAFGEAAQETLEKVAARTGRAAAVVGFPHAERDLYNAAAVCACGKVEGVYHKHLLPNYGVFDEERYFEPGTADCSIRLASSALGISVCEDAWGPGLPWDAYARRGVKVIPNINASPYHRGKVHERLEVCRDRARETGAWIVYVNSVGGQDEVVFDGGSIVVSPAGDLAWYATQFEEDLLVVDLDVPEAPAGFDGIPVVDAAPAKPPLPDPARPAWPSEPEEVYRAIVLGLRDYLTKNGFREAVVGLSGGIDSALVATLAADALGPGAVRALSMPSPYSSEASVTDARELARRLGIRLDTIPIHGIFSEYRGSLSDVFGGDGAAWPRRTCRPGSGATC
jgi:NAD+ synthase (glutamine-hydrolysing)